MRLLRQQRRPACLRAVKRSIVGAVDQIRGIWATSPAQARAEPQPRRRPKSTALKTKQQSWRQTLNLETVKCVQMASDLASCAVHSGFTWSFDVCSGPQPTWSSQPTTPYPTSTPRLAKRASAPPQTHNIPKGNIVIDIAPIPEEFEQAIPLLDMSNKPTARPHSFI